MVAGQTATVNFQMGITAIELEGLVATGYATQTRREVSSAISTVRSLDLENPTVASLDAILLGKAPGVEVIQNAGNPGNGITVRIRGIVVHLRQQPAPLRGGWDAHLPGKLRPDSVSGGRTFRPSPA